ncbi:MAG TPA: class I SAM-dependent methyltransferase [Micromonosporaceae bacterium]
MQALRQRFVDAPDSWAARRRTRRWTWLVETFPDLAELSVIDLGGSVESWRRAPVRPRRVHVVNLEEQPGEVPEWAEVDYGDACALPDRITSRRYDLVFSNSVIEHVGGHERRVRFAEAVRGLADRYWVQTPYRYFPVEPHYLAPGMQFTPTALRHRIAYRWPLSHTRAANRRDALTESLWVELLDRTQMRYYFPDATLRQEKVAGLTKSLIAFRSVARSAG